MKLSYFKKKNLQNKHSSILKKTKHKKHTKKNNKNNKTKPKKFIYRKTVKKGGAINLPIYSYDSSLSEEQNVCKELTTHNLKLQTSKEKGEQITLDTINSIKASVPLYNFINIIKSNCSITEQNSNSPTHIILIDKDGNECYTTFNSVPLKYFSCHVFELNERYQIKYRGFDTKHMTYPSTFDECYSYFDYYYYTKDCYWINTLRYLQQQHFVGQFYNISHFKKQNLEKLNGYEEVTLTDYTKFIQEFLPRTQEGITKITKQNNIVKNITFINMMEEFINLINLDYECFFSNKFESFLKNLIIQLRMKNYY